MAPQYLTGRSRPAARALLALPFLALLLLAPAAAPAATSSELKQCTDKAWAEYNTCLVQTSSEWERNGCDVAFSTDYAMCWAKYLGTIKAFFA